MHLKKNTFSVLKAKNGDEAADQLSFPQIQLDMMEPNICLVSIKLDFVTIFSNFYDAKMWVCDSFRFGPEKTFHFLLFFCENLLYRLG